MSTPDTCHLIAFDEAQLARIRRALRDTTALAFELAQVAPSPEVNVAHLESVITQRKLVGLPRTLVMLRSPRTWPREIAEHLTAHPEGDWEPLLLPALAREERRLCALGALVAFSPSFRDRFSSPEECADFPAHQPVVLEALGGEPDPSATDEAEALKNAIHPPSSVKTIAAALRRLDVESLRLPVFPTLTEEQFEAELARVSALAEECGEFPTYTPAMRFTQLGFGGEREVLEALSAFYSSAAENEWAVSVRWGRGP